MLIFSSSRITIRGGGDIRVEGELAKYRGRIVGFIKDLGLTRGVISRRFGRFVFSRNIDDGKRQRLRNFFGAECPMKRR